MGIGIWYRAMEQQKKTRNLVPIEGRGNAKWKPCRNRTMEMRWNEWYMGIENKPHRNLTSQAGMNEERVGE